MSNPTAPKPRKTGRKILFGVIGLTVLVAVIASCNSNATTGPSGPPAAAPTYTAAPVIPAAPVTPAAPAGPATTATSGTYEVGVDLAAGRYKTAGPDQSDYIPNCYYARHSDDSGELKSIIANDNLAGPGSVTVKAGEFVEFSGSCTWTKTS